MSDAVRVFIEDDPSLGPWFCTATALPTSTADPSSYIEGLCVVPTAQVERWQRAQGAWEEAQREMRPYLEQRRRELVANIGRYSGVEAAQRAEARLMRRGGRR
jgi:hypothetical protein